MITYSKVSELYEYIANNVHGAEFSLKGHTRPWIIKNGDFKVGQKIIDIGAGYSDIAFYLQETYSTESWVLDNFEDELWQRWGDFKKLPEKYPGVKYIFDQAGNFNKNLPDEYYDRVISCSVLEHIPGKAMENVFKDMIRILKPGGLMIHTIDITISNGKLFPLPNLIYKIGRSIKKKENLINEPLFFMVSGWREFLNKFKELKWFEKPKHFNELSILLDPNTVYQPMDVVYNIFPPVNQPKGYSRTTSLNIILKKMKR